MSIEEPADGEIVLCEQCGNETMGETLCDLNCAYDRIEALAARLKEAEDAITYLREYLEAKGCKPDDDYSIKYTKE